MLEFIHPSRSLPDLSWGQTTRQGGVSTFSSSCNKVLNMASHVGDDPSAIEQNWLRFTDASQWSRQRIATCDQVHANGILEVTRGGHHCLEADALISRTPGLAVGIFTADCVPILVVDPLLREVAAIHCGWKGVASRLTEKVINELIAGKEERRSALLVWIGACIQQKSYEVGPEVAVQFDASFTKHGLLGKFQLDLPKAVLLQLLSSGVREANIESCGIDTYSSQSLLFSYRGERQKTGRMMTFIGFRK